MKRGGHLVFTPGIMDKLMGVSPLQHSISLYERNLEAYLAHRRRWLWRKACFVVRIIVKLMLHSKRRRSQHTKADGLDTMLAQHALGTDPNEDGQLPARTTGSHSDGIAVMQDQFSARAEKRRAAKMARTKCSPPAPPRPQSNQDPSDVDVVLFLPTMGEK